MEALLFEALKVVASGVVGGATAKIGEPFGEGVIVAARKVVERLQLNHQQATVKRLAESSEVIEAEIVEAVKQAAETYPDVRVALDEMGSAIAAEQSAYPNLTKVADKNAVANLGAVTNQTNNITL